MIVNNRMQYRIVANNVSLDLFDDEPIKISNNITDLFDISLLPSEITNDISIPGSKNNNEFFKHYYDLSIDNIDSYTTNKKVNCYIELEGVYMMQGYLMLNNVTLNGSYIESYNITVYGSLSYFGTLIKNKYLSDLTTLNIFNHNLTVTNITDSWDFKLFEGNIIYPLADYGQKVYYTNKKDGYGIDEQDGAMSVQDFKPSIKVKNIFDAIFLEAGYTYESNFLESSGYLDNCYFLLNKYKKYPIIENYNLEDYGKFKISPPKSILNQSMTYNVNYKLPYFSISENIGNKLVFTAPNTLKYTIDKSTILRGSINLNFKIFNDNNVSGKGVPQFQLIFKNNTNTYNTPLKKINDYMVEIHSSLISQNLNTPTQEYTLLCEFNTPYMVPGDYEIYLNYTRYDADSNFSIKIDTSSSPESYLIIDKQLNLGDNEEIIITNQFPEMKQIDFIKGLQKKFNLIIYPSNTQLNHFIIETFNDWYKRTEVKNFNNFIDLNNKISITPANNLAYKTLTFKDKLDKDYVSKTFNDEANREYGMQTYTDDDNNYSTDELTIETPFASSPLVRIDNNAESGGIIIEQYYLNISYIKNNNYYVSGGGKGSGLILLGSNNILINIFSIYDYPYYNNGDNFDIKIRFKITNDDDNNSFLSNKDILLTVNNGIGIINQSFSYNKWNGVNNITQTPICIVEIPSNVHIKSTSQLQMC